MTQEEKDLLVKDLCARLPYEVKVQYKGNQYNLTEMHKDGRTYLGSYNSIYGDWHCSLKFEDYPKPYLRPMSSMTEEEEDSLAELNCYHDNKGLYFSCGHSQTDICDVINFLNAHHFDYRNLIEKGLALEATSETYNKE